MKTSFVKVAIQGFATVAGLLGICMLSAAPYTILSSFIRLGVPSIVADFFLIELFLIALYIYCVFVAYLVWFRFSPLAIRHFIVMIGIFILIFAPRRIASYVPSIYFAPNVSSSDAEIFSNSFWTLLETIGGVAFVYFMYRVSTGWLTRTLFPVQSSEIPS